MAAWTLLFLALLAWLSSGVVAITSTSTVYFRKQTRGSIFAITSGDALPIELDGTKDAARFVALAVSPSRRLYWSDSRSIRSAQVDAGGLKASDHRTLVGTLTRVTWHGVNFGSREADIVQLSVRGTPCVSVTDWESTKVECVVALAGIDVTPVEDDCVITTTRGSMRGVARNRYAEMRASGLESPLVERLEIAAAGVSPHAMAIDGDATLYWTNAADGTIYRSSLENSSISALQVNEWGVKGLVLLRSLITDRATPVEVVDLLYSVEGKGLIKHVRVGKAESRVLLSGLHSPRGLAIDPAGQYLYFTEKTGRIYRVALRTPTSSQAVSVIGAPELILTLPTQTRLDGLAVDDRNLYWCESNTDVIARASVDTLEREVVIGGTADSALSWPRSIALASSNGAGNAAVTDFFFTEYTGRISIGTRVLVDALAASNMKNLDQALQQRDSTTQHFFALE